MQLVPQCDRPTRQFLRAAALTMTLLAHGSAAGASKAAFEREQRLVGDADAGQFGEAVALSGRRLVVVAPDSPAGSDDGRAYIFERPSNKWIQVDRLTPTAEISTAGQRFGTSVAISGRVLAVGSHAGDAATDTDPGAVYVFERRQGAWQQMARLTIEGIAAKDGFGQRVALSGRFLAVAAPGADRVYLFQFRRQQWQLHTTLEVSSADTVFGDSIGLSGQTLVVGAPGGFFLSSAYVYERAGSTWEQQAQLLPELVDPSGFGTAVDIDGEILVVGANNELNSDRVGAAYLYERQPTGWERLQRITAGGSGLDRFGQSIAVDGSRVIVGAPASLGFTGDAAYVYERIDGVWTQTFRLVSGDGVGGVAFGASVTINGATAAVGSRSRNAVSTFR